MSGTSFAHYLIVGVVASSTFKQTKQKAAAKRFLRLGNRPAPANVVVVVARNHGRSSQQTEGTPVVRHIGRSLSVRRRRTASLALTICRPSMRRDPTGPVSPMTITVSAINLSHPCGCFSVFSSTRTTRRPCALSI